MAGLEIRRLRSEESFPMPLLLLSDPSHEVVESYIHRGRCFIGEWNGQIVGVYVLIDTRPLTVELVNIAVAEDKQGMGIGSLHAIRLPAPRDTRPSKLERGIPVLVNWRCIRSADFVLLV